MENSIHSRFNDAIATIMGCLADEVDKLLTDLLFNPLNLACDVRDVDFLKIKRFIVTSQLNPLDGGMYLVIDDWGGITPCLRIDSWLTIGRNAGMSSVETVYSPEAKAQPGMNPGVVGHDWIEVKVTFEPNAVVIHREFMAENFNAMSPAWTGRANSQLRWRAIAQAIRFKSGIQAGVEEVSSSSVIRAQQAVQIDQVKPEAKPQAEQRSEAKPEAKPQAEQRSEAKPEAKPQAEQRSEAKPEAKPQAEQRSEAKPEAEPQAEQRSEAKPEAEPQAEQRSEAKPEAEPQAEQRSEAKPEAEPQAEQRSEAKPEAKPQGTFKVAEFNGSNHSLIIDQLLNGNPLPEASGREHIGKMRTVLQRCYQGGEWEQLERYLRVGAPNASKAENDWRLQVFDLFRKAVAA